MNSIKQADVGHFVASALKEDIGSGDITSLSVIPRNVFARAYLIAQETGVLCGMELARLSFKKTDDKLHFKALVKDGSRVKKGTVVAVINGPAAGLLSAERVAINFIGLLSGIATRTDTFVRKVKAYKLKILDTRKTLPGLRALEKYAVRVGGGFNHRSGLYDMFLIKENHIDTAGIKNMGEALSDVRRKVGAGVKVEVEARGIKEFKAVLLLKPDIIMLDNMSIKDIKEAVKLKGPGKPYLEASGNISLKNIRSYAGAGVDFVSLGTLTKDIDSLDFSMDIKRIWRRK